MTGRPPRLVLALLRWAAGPMADEVEGDMHEWTARWTRAWGPLRGRLAAIGVGLGLVVRLAAGRLVERARPTAGWSLDARLAARLLWRHPGLSLTSVVALAVTMGLATAAFTVSRAALYSTLPVAEGDRIVMFQVRDEATRQRLTATWAEFAQWRRATSLDHTAGVVSTQMNLSRDGVPLRSVQGARVSPAVFRFVPATPVLGTVFTPEMVAGTPNVLLIGEDVWTANFGRDPGVIGLDVEVDGIPHTIVGVLPDDWEFPWDHRAWTPLVPPAGASPEARSTSGLYLVGRLAPGVTRRAAASEATALVQAAPRLPDRTPFAVAHTFANGNSDPGSSAVMFVGISALVLLVVVAAANVANLVLARTEARRGELAVRTALGASRGRVVGQLFIESLVLTSIAAAFGVTISTFAMNWLESVVTELPYYADLSPGPDVVVFAVLLAGIAALFAGVVPALRATASGVAEGVRTGGRGVGFGRFSQAMIVLELAISVALLGTAFAVGQSFLGYTRPGAVDLPKDRVVTATLYYPWRGEEAEGMSISDFARRLRGGLRERLEEQLGVGSVGLTTDLPGTEPGRSRVEVEGVAEVRNVLETAVDPGFFSVLDVDAVAGRGFTETDLDPEAPDALLVNDPFVEQILGGRNALGRRIRFHYPDGDIGVWGTIVGVVPDLNMNPGDPRSGAVVYRTLPGTNYLRVMVRAGAVGRSDPLEVMPLLREAALSVDPRLQVRDGRMLKDAARDQRALLSGVGSALFGLGAMALLLSSAGLYAILSFGVARRTREIGVRIALGASVRRIVLSVGLRVGRSLLLGVVLGVAVGLAMLRAMAVLPFTIRVEPLLHLGGPSLLLVAVAVAAMGRPLRRAIAIRPADALRAD